MFRDRPLTCLFIAATLVLDWVLFATVNNSGGMPASIGSVLLVYLAVGLVLGQLAAVAIWSVRGRTHRLVRASCLVLATWGLNCLLPRNDDGFSILSGYAFVLVVVTLLADYLHIRFRRNLESTELKNRWQISLIECFGWTIVVSIISFGARLMSFQFLLEPEPVWVVVAFLSVPVAVSVLVRCDLRDLKVIPAIGVVLVAIAAAKYLSTMEPGLKYLVGIQTVYLTLWLAVLGMDDVFVKMKNVRQPLGKEALPVDVPESFDLEA